MPVKYTNLTTQELPDGTAEHLSPISVTGVRRLTGSFELNLPSLSLLIDHLSQVPLKLSIYSYKEKRKAKTF